MCAICTGPLYVTGAVSASAGLQVRLSNIALQVGYFSLALARETSALCALSESPNNTEVERGREKIVGILKTFPAIETTRDAILE